MASIRLISHASVLVDVGGVRILSDPWQSGKAFNDSWSLLVDPFNLDDALAQVDYLWISHEHPDHFHVQTLRSMPAEFKRRTTVLFQENHSEKMVSAFKELLGFGRVIVLPHRRPVELRNKVKVYCFHSRQIDSALAISGEGVTILNLNDCGMSDRDLADLRQDLGRPDVVLNQFSIAGFEGSEAGLAQEATTVLSNYVRDSVTLGARYTVPFASFVYFSCTDNKFINRYANTPRRAVDALAGYNLASVVLRPGDQWELGEPWDNAPALQFYDEAFGSIDSKPYDEPEPVSFDALKTAFGQFADHLHDKYSGLFLRRLKPVAVEVVDIGETVVFEIPTRRFERAPEGTVPDLRMNSQPLEFCFCHPFGVQTLGVSGRYRILNNAANWARHRLICALNNAEIYLKPRYMFRWKVLAYFWSRRKGLLEQVRHRIDEMRRSAGGTPARQSRKH